MEEEIRKVLQRWFLMEPVLFQVFCTHELVENAEMYCPMRVGKGKVEYNPKVLESLGEGCLEEVMKGEGIRVLLKHPYDRQPEDCSWVAKALGSNCVLAEHYNFKDLGYKGPEQLHLDAEQHYEAYARLIQQRMKAEENLEVPSSLTTAEILTSDLAENWQEDDLRAEQVNQLIRDTQHWGSLPGGLVEQIVAGTKAKLDYRKVLAGFRASVLAQARRLTRMRPNRRMGFKAMGSQHNFTTRLLVGIDASQSISQDDLANFYTTINHFFSYGVSEIDVLQFDTQLYPLQSLSKAVERVEVQGRGGTAFQPFIDYVCQHPEYDGALIYTDGYALPPEVPESMRTPLCWVLDNEKNLMEHEQWMSKYGVVCISK